MTIEEPPNHPDYEPKVLSITCLSCGAEMIPSKIAYHHTFFHKELDNVKYRIDKVETQTEVNLRNEDHS